MVGTAAKMKYAFLMLAVCCLWYAPVTYATPYLTPDEIAAEFDRSGAAVQPQFELPRDYSGSRTLDEIAYFSHYRMLCDFLVSLQNMEAGAEYGGMIEGESGSDAGIIQTDNTQEAIRVWSQYAIWTGDTAAYSHNIRLAQGYCRRFPAWREGAGYYSIHNCGWGFEAERIYRQAYSDTSWTWYADSCALWVVANPLDYNPNSTDLGQLNPCAEGLGIGGMYPHTLYRQRTDWRQFALQEARRLRQWFESNPNRLNANETWALCGGTALWGICESLFAAYPDSGQTWLAQYGPLLDVWQSTGQWNHSFNTWYCNAQHVCFEITGDSAYWRNAVFITDSLIGLDTDDDGGIPPGRTFPVTNDHSWVSAYMGWMGMERIINSRPINDVVAVGFVSPRSDVPYLAGDSLVVIAHLVNAGMTATNVHVSISGQAYAETLSFAIDTGVDTLLTLGRSWVLPDDQTLPETSPLTLLITAERDEDPQNDSITSNIDVRRGVEIVGVINTEQIRPPFPVRIEFFHEGYPDSIWTVIEQSTDSQYTSGSRKLMAGMNTIRVQPPIQMMVTDSTVNVTPGPEPQRVDIILPMTDIALVDDDNGAAYEEYFIVSLDSIARRIRLWDKARLGIPSLSEVPTVVWFTGDDSATALTVDEQTELTAYLDDGGNLLLTGQNITDALGTSSQFLTTVLHCSSRTNTTNLRRVYGVQDNPISAGMDIYLLGSQGAQNQNSTSSIYVLDGSTEVMHYSTGDNPETCGVSGEYGQGKYVFLSFGLEGVSGINNTTSRTNILTRCFAWFGDDLMSDYPSPFVPNRIELAQNYPNPFNPSTTIQFSVSAGAGTVRLTLFNLLGQEIRTLYCGSSPAGMITLQWDGTTDAGMPVPSGTYIYRLTAVETSLARTLQLVR
ncbi:MAG: FlgD immunoglobulin-like domain containing protein [Calditrichota bacterium]